MVEEATARLRVLIRPPLLPDRSALCAKKKDPLLTLLGRVTEIRFSVSGERP